MEVTREIGRGRDRRGDEGTGLRVVGALARVTEPAVLVRLEGGVLLALSVLLSTR